MGAGSSGPAGQERPQRGAGARGDLGAVGEGGDVELELAQAVGGLARLPDVEAEGLGGVAQPRTLNTASPVISTPVPRCR
jgi:hypothetical protein